MLLWHLRFAQPAAGGYNTATLLCADQRGPQAGQCGAPKPWFLVQNMRQTPRLPIALGPAQRTAQPRHGHDARVCILRDAGPHALVSEWSRRAKIATTLCTSWLYIFAFSCIHTHRPSKSASNDQEDTRAVKDRCAAQAPHGCACRAPPLTLQRCICRRRRFSEWLACTEKAQPSPVFKAATHDSQRCTAGEVDRLAWPALACILPTSQCHNNA